MPRPSNLHLQRKKKSALEHRKKQRVSHLRRSFSKRRIALKPFANALKNLLNKKKDGRK